MVVQVSQLAQLPGKNDLDTSLTPKTQWKVWAERLKWLVDTSYVLYLSINYLSQALKLLQSKAMEVANIWTYLGHFDDGIRSQYLLFEASGCQGRQNIMRFVFTFVYKERIFENLNMQKAKWATQSWPK